MNAANNVVVDLLDGITDEKSKDLEVVAVAAHVLQRYGVRFMQREKSAFCKFSIKLGEEKISVTILVLPPKGETYKYTRFNVYATRSWAEGDSLEFVAMNTQQVFQALGDMHSSAAYVFRLRGNGARKNTAAPAAEDAAS